MRASKKLTSIFLCCSLAACTTYIPITENYDEFSNTKSIKMDRCKLQANYPTKAEAIIFDQGKESLELNLEYSKEGDQPEKLQVIAEIITEGETFTIDNGESLIFAIDGEIVKLSTKGGYDSDMDVKVRGTSSTTSFSSKAKFPITEQLISKIGNGQVVKARLLGYDRNAEDKDKPALEGIFTEAHKEAYKEFLLKIKA
ncbi:hypothetical protein [Owenweeksia hongkongensis]|uniref:hypothetical protein n=1 Tax=Owenweeksia hongkongensis TaxID=253245 RepID=UPI003A8FB515